jgi:hypothetical protein
MEVRLRGQRSVPRYVYCWLVMLTSNLVVHQEMINIIDVEGYQTLKTPPLEKRMIGEFGERYVVVIWNCGS